MSAASIANLRKLFEAELTEHPDQYHSVDIDRVRTQDWQVKRFLLGHPDNESKAFDALCKALRWKKSFGVHDRDDAYFPRELWEMSGAEISGRDKHGHLVHWGVAKRLRKSKSPKARLLMEQFVVHILERLDASAGEAGYIVVVDSNGAGVANVDLDMAKFVISILDYYQNGLRGSYTVDLPWLLNSIMKLVMTFLSAKMREKVHFEIGRAHV